MYAPLCPPIYHVALTVVTTRIGAKLSGKLSNFLSLVPLGTVDNCPPLERWDLNGIDPVPPGTAEILDCQPCLTDSVDFSTFPSDESLGYFLSVPAGTKSTRKILDLARLGQPGATNGFRSEMIFDVAFSREGKRLRFLGATQRPTRRDVKKFQ